MSVRNVELCNMYMKYRNSYKHGFMKYDYFKNVIRYITGLKDPERIRGIFQRLCEEELIERIELWKRGKRSLRYRHNPYGIEFLEYS